MGKFPQTDLESHSEVLSLYVLVVDAVLHELTVESQLTYAAADSPDNFADAVGGTCDYRPEEGYDPSFVASRFELIGELRRIAKYIQPRCNSHKTFHGVHLTDPVDVFLF
jgi:hypothetical protein